MLSLYFKMLVTSQGLIDCELNPLFSPPPGLMSERLEVIQNYLRVRLIRLNELEDLLFEEDFTKSLRRPHEVVPLWLPRKQSWEVYKGVSNIGLLWENEDFRGKRQLTNQYEATFDSV